MSKFVADHLPEALVARLGIDRAIENAGRAILICSVDEHGWPHPAMVSSLELVARDARNIRLALHTRSRSLRNVRDNGRLTVILADEQSVHYIKGDALVVSSTVSTRTDFARINLRVDSVLEDAAADYENSRITTGITIVRDAVDPAAARTLLEELLGT